MENNPMGIFMMVIEGGIGIYFIYNAIVGKGKAYELESVLPEKQEEYIKKSRIWFAVLGCLAILMALMDVLMTFAGMESLRIAYRVLLVLIVVATFVGYMSTKNCVKKIPR